MLLYYFQIPTVKRVEEDWGKQPRQTLKQLKNDKTDPQGLKNGLSFFVSLKN